MSQGAFDFSEFIEPKKTQVEEEIEVVEEAEVFENEELEASDDEIDGSENIDVQKAVVESLAADKAALDIELEALKKTLAEKEELLANKESEIAAIKEEVAKKDFEISYLKVELAKNFEKQLDAQERNPNALALLDREVELPDRFLGETRDHVLEVIKEARDKAEEIGRRRRAQILESVLVANEPNGILAERRSIIEQVFAENNNVITGPVIETLTELELSHKEGEEYLLASEILLRNF
ncbi:MAG: hypothetical protein J6Q84_02060 [Kiritimatiellae bacterium]|nr:hypothetical protein [Kiritimatiellia bacterium]